MGINDIFVRYLGKTDACLRSILDVFVTDRNNIGHRE